MSEPTIISAYDPGYHGVNLEQSIARLNADASWRDLSTIIISPAGNDIPTRVVASWSNLIKPPNNRTLHDFAKGVEVGEAYSNYVMAILANSHLKDWKYVLTLEHDNIPPPDGLVALHRRMEAHPEFAAIGGLYFTKGYGGCAQIWGDPTETPINFRPQLPDPNGGLKECCGTGMGFTMFRLEMFKDSKLRRPWFKTTASRVEGSASQDLYFWNDARAHGYRCAIDCSVKVGHYDKENDFVW